MKNEKIIKPKAESLIINSVGQRPTEKKYVSRHCEVRSNPELKAYSLLFVILSLLMTISCSNNNNNNDINNSNNEINEHLEYLRKQFGFEFYEKLDTFSLKGINIIDTSNIKYPFYAISRRDDRPIVDVQYFSSSKNISYTSYQKVNDYYISTKIYNDSEYISMFSREVTIIYPDRIILYDYFIEGDFERLTEISFLYKNGDKKVYGNYSEWGIYYNICDTVNENNITTLFPTMEKWKY
jgi:hypothetical protein